MAVCGVGIAHQEFSVFSVQFSETCGTFGGQMPTLLVTLSPHFLFDNLQVVDRIDA
jgi:hypothetical protein